MTPDLKAAIKAAKYSGGIVRQGFLEAKIVTKKGKHDYVTTIDQRTENVIFSSLKHSQYAFLGEETGEINAKHSKKWIVDPIDGTSNFINGIPFFAISIGLLERDELILGVVYDPIHDECYWAEKGKGAFLNGSQIHVQESIDFADSLVLLEHGRSEASIDTYAKATKALMANNGVQLLRQGSTALMLCYFAKGSAAAFLSFGDELYDYAAGLVIAQEAGAVVTDWRGKKRTASTPYVLASASSLHPEIITRVKSLQKLHS